MSQQFDNLLMSGVMIPINGSINLDFNIKGDRFLSEDRVLAGLKIAEDMISETHKTLGGKSIVQKQNIITSMFPNMTTNRALNAYLKKISGPGWKGRSLSASTDVWKTSDWIEYFKIFNVEVTTPQQIRDYRGELRTEFDVMFDFKTKISSHAIPERIGTHKNCYMRYQQGAASLRNFHHSWDLIDYGLKVWLTEIINFISYLYELLISSPYTATWSYLHTSYDYSLMQDSDLKAFLIATHQEESNLRRF